MYKAGICSDTPLLRRTRCSVSGSEFAYFCERDQTGLLGGVSGERLRWRAGQGGGEACSSSLNSGLEWGAGRDVGESIFSLCYLFRNPFLSTTMGDENPIRTLGDYSRPSHEGYRNTIELPEGNNMPERLPTGSISTWEDLTTRFLAQFFLHGRTAKLRNDILMFQQHHGESLSKEWTRFKDLLQKVPHHGIDLWL
ncbi:zinc finger, CCHC-type containing protein [Tanacetum coccineum]